MAGFSIYSFIINKRNLFNIYCTHCFECVKELEHSAPTKKKKLGFFFPPDLKQLTLITKPLVSCILITNSFFKEDGRFSVS